MVKFGLVQKKVLCIEMADHLPKIREILHVNQKQFAAMSGISTDRLSRIENKHVVMTWSQMLAVISICSLNVSTKEYLFMNNVLPETFFQYMQQLDDQIPPIYNVIIRDEVIERYNELKEKKKAKDD